MERTVDPAILDWFAAGFFLQIIMLIAYIALRILLRDPTMGVYERIRCHWWCFGFTIITFVYFGALGTVTGELPTLIFGCGVPIAFAFMDLRALRGLTIALEGIEQQEAKAVVPTPPDSSD